MTATLPAPLSRTAAALATVSLDQRLRLQTEKALFDQRAQTAAHAGDLDQAAKAILAVLDCERRLAGFGPQVVQLIKPRN
jgi:hypothetical protein